MAYKTVMHDALMRRQLILQHRKLITEH